MLPENQYNIGYICTTWQTTQGKENHVAMRWIDTHGGTTDTNFAELDQLSNRVANALLQLGLMPEDRLFTFLPKMPEQFYTFLGALKVQLVCGTLFSNFGPEALEQRLGDAQAKVVVTKRSLLKKLTPARKNLPDLQYTILVDEAAHFPEEGLYSLPLLLATASPVYTTPCTPAEFPSVLHYTSGSTGCPKGVLHCHGSIISQQTTSREILGLRDNDIYWCTADQGWVTGTSYGIIGPWSLGVTQVHYGGGYDAKKWLHILQSEKISVWYSAPTALRMLMREEACLFDGVDLAELRHICSVGEPLNPEVIRWARKVLERDVYDTWFQTETGSIMIANRPGLVIREGSMGMAASGVMPQILGDDSLPVPEGEQGELCLKTPWPSMFIAYLNNKEGYQLKFYNGYYHTGDMAWRDRDGYYWFVGRSDDVINTAGHLVSPFEVESTLLELQEIAESGVVGIPDPLLFEKVVAFVLLRKGFAASKSLELKIRLHIANKLSTIATPQEIVFSETIPKNKSGKIMRRLLRDRYLGKDSGDISTLD